MLIAEIVERRTFAVPDTDSYTGVEKMLQKQKSVLVPVISKDARWLGNIYRHDLVASKNEQISLTDLARKDESVVSMSQHILEAARVMSRQRVDILPVVSTDDHYEGYLTREAVHEQIVRLMNLEEPGQVLFVEIEAHDFSLAQIVRFIEEENARLLGMLVDPPGSLRDTFRVSIKINKVDAGRIVSSLQRHGFTVSTPNEDASVNAEFLHRADELMHFLEM